MELACIPFGEEISAKGIEVYRSQCIVTIRFSRHLPKPQLRYRLAHEFGHILLDGLRCGESCAYHDSQADFFASHLLVPSVVLAEQQLNTVEEIIKYFEVPQKIAQLAWRGIKIQCCEINSFFHTMNVDMQNYTMNIKNSIISFPIGNFNRIFIVRFTIIDCKNMQLKIFLCIL